MSNVFAQEPLGTIGGSGLGPFGNITKEAGFGPATGLIKVTTGVSAVVGVMTVAAAIWFLFQLLVGGFFWMTSGGDKSRLHEARERLTNAFIGLLIVVGGWAILALVGQFLGYDIILGDPGAIISSLGIK